MQELEGSNLDCAMAQHLLVAADRFQLPRLRRICERRLCETVEVLISDAKVLCCRSGYTFVTSSFAQVPCCCPGCITVSNTDKLQSTTNLVKQAPVQSFNAKLLTTRPTELQLQQVSGQGVPLDSDEIDGSGRHSGHHVDSGGAESCGGAKEGVPGVCQPQSVHSDVLGGLPPHDQLLPPAAGTNDDSYNNSNNNNTSNNTDNKS